jgi:hypothetical protein
MLHGCTIVLTAPANVALQHRYKQGVHTCLLRHGTMLIGNELIGFVLEGSGVAGRGAADPALPRPKRCSTSPVNHSCCTYGPTRTPIFALEGSGVAGGLKGGGGLPSTPRETVAQLLY